MSLLTSAVGLATSFIPESWMSKIRMDYPVAWKFEVEIDGIRDKGFSEATGLGRTLTLDTTREANSFSPTLMPSSYSINPVTLKKAISFDSKLEEWFREVETYKRGDPDPRRNVVITQLYNVPAFVPYVGGTAVALKSWHLPECVIFEVLYPSFNATKDDGISILSAKLKSSGIVDTSDYGGIFSLLSFIQAYS